MPLYVTIHGHFYQPPRENPWLEAVEVQDSAYPYHDWNFRVTAESYRPNATSRILEANGLIESVVNNYSKMSFNFGPTLLVWLEHFAPDVYQAILDADKESIQRFAGHGSAIAQAYNHMIMPLANRRDKTTQVIWGIEDFKRRFGRDPKGMWLPETAVDIETLEVLAEQGIGFSILAPRQANRVRYNIQPRDEMPLPEWHDVSGERIDHRQAYIANLPSGRSINLFFYNGSLARSVAFEGLLKDGAKFAEYLIGGFDHSNPSPQLSHIATDGETYGHHHRFGDMALAFALQRIEHDPEIQLTNYSQFLALHPPTHEVEIIERTAWSCSHGVERWRGDCGCATGEHPDWRQTWRWPLREALDWLRDEIAPKFEEKAAVLLHDPWGARNRYIRLVLDRSQDDVEQFFMEEAKGGLTVNERAEILMMMEMQRHLMLMYTSCGWFFDDVAGIETVQDLAYAGRSVQLAQMLFGENVESRFVGLLEKVIGNRPELSDGKIVYDQMVRPMIVNQLKLCAHYGLTGLFEEQANNASFYKFDVQRISGRSFESGRAKLSLGRVQVSSRITHKSDELCYAAVHFGDHNLSCGVKFWPGEEEYRLMFKELSTAFGRSDITAVIRLLDKHFDGDTFALRSLFRDGQRKLLKRILKQTLLVTESLYREIYEDHTPLMRFLVDMGAPVPKAFTTAAEFILNGDIKRCVMIEELDSERITMMLEEGEQWGVNLDLDGLKYKLTQTVDKLAADFELLPMDLERLRKLLKGVRLSEETILDANLWTAQNVCYRISKRLVDQVRTKAHEGDTEAEEWFWEFKKLTELLKVKIG